MIHLWGTNSSDTQNKATPIQYYRSMIQTPDQVLPQTWLYLLSVDLWKTNVNLWIILSQLEQVVWVPVKQSAKSSIARLKERPKSSLQSITERCIRRLRIRFHSFFSKYVVNLFLWRLWTKSIIGIAITITITKQPTLQTPHNCRHVTMHVT